MKIHLLTFAMLAVITFSSCGDDEEAAPPPHEVGEWTLENYALMNLPPDYQRYEGSTFPPSVFGTESYTLKLLVNKTFEREIETAGTLPQDDMGTYTISEDELILNSHDSADEEVYNLERNRNNRLWLGLPIQTLLLTDAIADTITQEYINSLTEQEYEDLHDIVSLDLIFAFEKPE